MTVLCHLTTHVRSCLYNVDGIQESVEIFFFGWISENCLQRRYNGKWWIQRDLLSSVP